MTQWSMSNVPGWKGLKPSSTNSLLLAKPLDSKNVQIPPGFDSKMLAQSQVEQAVEAQTNNKSADAEQREIVMNRIAWNTALAPVKQLPMNAFMMYMMGGQIGIFSIMMLGMSLFRVISSVASIKQVSKSLESSENYYLQMLCWFLGQAAVVQRVVNFVF